MNVVCQETGDTLTVSGPRVKAPSRYAAQKLLDKHKFTYLWIEGELVAEIPCIPGTHEPDWNKMIDYDAIENN